MEDENKYLLTETELQMFLKADAWLRHLRFAGVDNTMPYEDACETLHDEDGRLCKEEQEYFDRFKAMHKYEK